MASALYLVIYAICLAACFSPVYWMFSGVLFYCICPTQRHEKCLEIAVNHGAEVNNRAIDGTPLLVKACETAVENEDMCITLIKKGADPNAKHDVSVIQCKV